jgi:hypothetical protein
MRTHLASLLLLLASAFQSWAEPPAASKAGDHDWGFIKFAEVRAYRMNWEKMNSPASIIHEEGVLNATRLPVEGVLLDETQVATLKKAATRKQPLDGEGLGCFYPHHAFVFYNRDGTITGYLDVCFICRGTQGEPAGFPEKGNIKSLEELFQKLGIPLSNPDWDLKTE